MEDNFDLGSGATGLFGLFGIVGALATTVAEKINNKIAKNKIILFSTLLLIASWVIFLISGNSLVGLVIGIILVDLGLQVLHITNKNIILSKNPEARNRINTIYMVGFFIGGALGTSLGALAWQHYQWIGVSVLGNLLSVGILLVHLIFRNKTI
jgi:predicted MFS family arabinose efflux permease